MVNIRLLLKAQYLFLHLLFLLIKDKDVFD